MAFRDGESVSEDRAFMRFSGAGFLDESPGLSKVLAACGQKVRDELLEQKEEQGQTGLRSGEDCAE